MTVLTLCCWQDLAVNRLLVPLLRPLCCSHSEPCWQRCALAQLLPDDTLGSLIHKPLHMVSMSVQVPFCSRYIFIFFHLT